MRAPLAFGAESFFETPVHLAARHGDGPMIELLISKGAVVNIPNIEKETPLHIACRRAPSLFGNALLPTDSNHIWKLLRKMRVVSDDKQTMKAGLSR